MVVFEKYASDCTWLEGIASDKSSDSRYLPPEFIEAIRDEVSEGGAAKVILYAVSNLTDKTVSVIEASEPDDMNEIGDSLNLINGKVILESKSIPSSIVLGMIAGDDGYSEPYVVTYAADRSSSSLTETAVDVLAKTIINAHPKFKKANRNKLKADIRDTIKTGSVPSNCIFKRTLTDLLPILNIET